MTGDRQRLIAPRLVSTSIAALDDIESIETRPLSAIKTDLEKLGIDPQAPIDRARKLAAKKSSPADRLLARLDDADAIDAEIEALEHADIDEVRGNVPSGTAAGVAADAKRRAGIPSNVTGIKRPHRRVLGWGGSIVGLAACLLLFVITRPDQLYQLEQPVVEEADDVVAFSDSATTEHAVIDKVFEASRGAYPEEKAGTADQALALGEPRQHIEQPSALPTTEAEMALESLASRAARSRHDLDENLVAESQATARLSKQEEREQADLEIAAAAPVSEPSHRPEAKPAIPAEASREDVVALAPEATHRPKARAPIPAEPNDAALALAPRNAPVLLNKPARPKASSEETVSTALAENLGAVRRELDQLEFDTPSDVVGLADAADDWSNPRAVLIVDPDKAPSALKAQAETLPTGNLADRLDEARRLAGDGDVVALVTVLREGREVDAALALQPRASFADVGAIASFDAAPQGYDDGDVEFIELPRKP